jgi:hypothetical protein
MPALQPGPPVDATVAGKAVLDLCDLAIRCLSVDQRGRTTLAVDDEATFRKIAELLDRQKDLYAAEKIGRKTPELTADMQKLGWLRLALNDLCEYAAEYATKYAASKTESDAVDELLAQEMEKLFFRSRDRVPVEREHIEKAIRAAKRSEKALRADPDRPPRHWLRTASDSNTSDTTSSGAG